MIETRTGNTLTSESSEAAHLYQQAIDLILGSESGAGETLDKALELDNGFALAAAARYFVAKDVGEPDALTYRELAEQTSSNATYWEREHVDILIGLIDRAAETRAKALAYVKKTPSDLLVISKLTGNMLFYDGSKKLDTVLSVFESVEGTLGNDWAFLARLGFAASEAGQRKRGRELLERALTIRPQSLYSIHGLAHVLHDEGASEESEKLLQDWLKKYESSARQGQMYGHVQWHLALASWQIGDHEAAMQRYLEFCTPEKTTCGPILTLADCGGFLLRNYLQSGQTKVLENDVLKVIEGVWRMIGHPFIALHVAALYASAGDLAGLKRCEVTISETPRGAYHDISLALVSSLGHLVKGEYQRATQILETISSSARVGIGGSNVERILVDLIEKSCKTWH